MSKINFLNKLLPNIIISLIIVSLISIVTFWFILRGTLYAASEEDFFDHGEIYSLIIEEHVDKLNSVAFQLGSRTQMRTALQGFIRDEISLEEATDRINPKLKDGVEASREASGAIWIDQKGQVVASHGTTEPSLDLPSISAKLMNEDMYISAPIVLNEKTYFRIATKLISGDDQHLGYNIVYFPTLKLEQLVKRKLDKDDHFKIIGLSESYETILNFSFDPIENQHVQDRISQIKFNTIPENGIYFEHNGYAITLVPIIGTPWFVENNINLTDLHRPINRLLTMSFILILIMVAISILSSWKIVQASVKEVNLYQDKLMDTNEDLSDSLKELKKTQDQLIRRETLAALGELVGGLMHELNTPIGTAITSLSFMDSEVKALVDPKKQDVSHYNEAYNITLNNLQKAVSNIETFRILNMDQATLEMRRIALKSYIDEVVMSLKPKLKRTSHTVTVNCDDHLFAVTTPGLLSQILTNLITNSLKHGFENMQNGSITIDVKREGNILFIDYTDNGVGIPENHLPHVFEPYFTTKRHDGGTGLGLHIIYSLVTSQLQGTIDIESSPGQGTKFKIHFPVS